MSDIIQSPNPVIVTPNPSPAFDPKDIVEATNGVISGDGKGFMPLTDFPPTKPYEDWQGFLDKQRDTLEQERQRLAAEDPKTFFEEQARKFEAEKNRLEQRCESNLESRLSDLEKRYEERLDYQTKYQKDELTLRNVEIEKLEAKNKELEEREKELNEQILTERNQLFEENKQYYGKRADDMESYRNELRSILQTANQDAGMQTERICERFQKFIETYENKRNKSDLLSEVELSYNKKTSMVVKVLACAMSVISVLLFIILIVLLLKK